MREKNSCKLLIRAQALLIGAVTLFASGYFNTLFAMQNTPLAMQNTPLAMQNTPEQEIRIPEQKIRFGSEVRLPEPVFPETTLGEAVKKRRSVRQYSGRPISVSELSVLLFSAQGITGEIFGQQLRTAPSAGALYPIKLYVFVHNVSGLPQGLYYYSPFKHSLIMVREGDLAKALSKAGLGQEALEGAGAVVALTAVFGRTNWKYGDRSYRYIYMEAGHIAQNMALAAASMGLGGVNIGAFQDKELNRLIGLSGEESSLYLFAAGKI